MHVNDVFANYWVHIAGVSGNSRSREYRPPIPVPKVGNGIFHSHSRSRKWEWNFHNRSRSRKLEMEFSTWIPVPEIWEWNLPFPFPKSKSHSRSPLVEWKSKKAAATPSSMKLLFFFPTHIRNPSDIEKTLSMRLGRLDKKPEGEKKHEGRKK